MALLFTEAHGAERVGSPFFQAGVKASRAGQYEEALAMFRKARAEGLSKASLFYNIGVCAYKLGLYSQAEEAFRQTATFPKMAPLAYYNLGIVAEKQADHKQALAWLTRARKTSTAQDKKLVLLIENAINRLSEQEPSPRWERYLSLGFGYDDNVELVGSSDILEASYEQDSFLDFFFFARRPLLDSSLAEGPYIQTMFSFLKYAEFNEYDTGSAKLELFHRRNIGLYQLEGGGGYGYVYFDGRSYEQSPMLSLQIRRPLAERFSVRFRYRVDYKDILDNRYDYLAGWRHRTMAEISGKWQKTRAYLAYTMENNDRDDEDYSPVRHTVAGGVTLRHLPNTDLKLSCSYRDSSYAIGDAPDREEERIDSNIMLIYYLKRGWEVIGQYTHSVNNSNYPTYDFTRNTVTLSVARFF